MIKDGDSVKDILLYWAPELVSAAVLFTLPMLLDAIIISQLRSTTTYGALGIANNFLHLLTKLAESIQVASTTVVGRFNGAEDYESAGKTLGDTFWTTLIVGSIPTIILFTFATEIFVWLGVPAKMVTIGAPYIRLRAVSVLLMFIYLAFLGFLRGIKNTRTPMFIYITGVIIFVIFDYVLVLGKCGFPQMRLQGSATATIIQFLVMNILSIIYILRNAEYRKYFTRAFYYLFDKAGSLRILSLSWQIAIDKASLAFAYVGLSWMIAPMGKYAIASFGVIKDLERLAFLPGIAFASVLTFLVSNRLGAQDPDGARANVKKVLVLAGISIVSILFVLCLDPAFFVRFVDHKDKFTSLASRVFPVISVLVVLDFVQLILAAALRGAGDVRTVMLVRAITCFGFFWPMGWYISRIPMDNIALKFMLIYGLFYINNGLMGILFIIRMKTKKWTKSEGMIK